MAVPLIQIENARGEVLDLSADPRYVPILQNVGPVAATINHSKVGTAPGTKFNSATVGNRNPLLTVYLVRDVARARLNLYRYIVPQEYIKIYYQNDGFNVWLDGYVETAEVDPWTQEENLAASIICPDPYWKDVSEIHTDASAVTNLFEFPFAIAEAGMELSLVDHIKTTVINNDGTIEAGCRFELLATASCKNPRIHNLDTGAYIGCQVDLLAGDRIVINTAPNNKSITLIRDGEQRNYINTFMEGSSWLTMAVGSNEFSYTVDEGEMELHIYHTNRYIGV